MIITQVGYRLKCRRQNIAGPAPSPAPAPAPAPAPGNYTKFVSAAAVGGGTGSDLNPWTMTEACAQAVPDVIGVQDGFYTDPNITTWEYAFNPTNNGIAGNPIIFKSINPRGAVLVRAQGYYPSIGLQNKSYIQLQDFSSQGMLQLLFCDHCIVSGCDVTLGSIQGGPVDNSLHWLLNLQSSNYCTISNNYIHNPEVGLGNGSHNTGALQVGYGSTFNIIEKNTVDSGGGVVFGGLHQKGGGMDDNTWKYNQVSNAIAGAYGMGSTNDLLFNNRNIYYQNIITNCTYGWYLHHNCLDWQIYNNTIYNMTDSAIHGGEYPEDGRDPQRIIIRDNIANTMQSFLRKEFPVPITLSRFISSSNYNLAYLPTYWWTENWGGTHQTTLANWNAASGFDANSLTSDPLFTNLGLGDFTLQAGSPALTGSSVGGPIGAYITGLEQIGHLW